MARPLFPLRPLALLAALTAGPLLGACHRAPEKASAVAPPVDPGFLATRVDPKPAVTPELIAHGKELFEKNCSACHGMKGDGKGYGAPFLSPPPRDFTRGVFKLRTTPSGSLPRDEDLYRTVSRGISGTAMPAWQWFLTDPRDRWALVEYVKTFSARWKEEQASDPMEIGQAPADVASAAMVERGKAVYQQMGCFNCHGAEGLGDGPSALTLQDDWGNHIGARDFSNVASFKGGWNEREIARTFLTGLDGTPMPSYGDSIPAADIWALAAYVKSLGRPHPMIDVASHGLEHGSGPNPATLGPPDVKVALLERGWHYEPNVIHVRKGQVVEVTLTTTDNGLGAGHGFDVDGMDDETFLNGARVGAPKSVKFRADRAGTFRFHCVTQCSTGYLHPNMTGILVVDDDNRG